MKSQQSTRGAAVATGILIASGLFLGLASLVGASGSPPTDEVATQILDDGKVDFDEYRSTVEATRACLRSEGLKVSNSTIGKYGIIHFTFSFGDPAVTERDRALAEEADAIYERCYDDNQGATEEHYLRAALPSPAEAAEAEEMGRRCLADLGLDFSREDNPNDIIVSALRVEGAMDCLSLFPYFYTE